MAKAGTLQKLPNANELLGPISLWEHLRLNSEDDPEARIRELEQPLAEAARTSESGQSQSPGNWAAPSAPPLQPPPLPYDGSLFGSSLRTTSRGRTWWIVAAVFVIGMIALPAGVILFTAHQVSRSGVTTILPIPGNSSSRPSPSGGIQHRRDHRSLHKPLGVRCAEQGDGRGGRQHSGFSNQVTYRQGSPHIESGQGNDVHQG